MGYGLNSEMSRAALIFELEITSAFIALSHSY